MTLFRDLYSYFLRHSINITLIVLLFTIILIVSVLNNVRYTLTPLPEADDTLKTDVITIQGIEGMTGMTGKEEVTGIEGIEATQDMDTIAKIKSGFCGLHQGNSDDLEEACGKLSENVCSSTSCCVYMMTKGGVQGGMKKQNSENSENNNNDNDNDNDNENRGGMCVAGNQSGPTYHTNDDGTTRDIDYYYYNGKCYGTNCPRI